MGIFFKRLFATIFGIIVGVSLSILILVAAIVASITYFTSTPVPEVKRGSVLEINMEQPIVDSPRITPLISLSTLSINTTQTTTLLDVLMALDAAAEDPNITAISLRLDGAVSLPLALISELRGALKEFRQTSGKPIYAYAEEYSQSEYLLASIADRIFLNPMGAIEWKGIATQSMYYGDLLGRMSVDVETFRPTSCLYKSAIEPYTRASMSSESREQSQQLVDSFWESMVRQVAFDRKIDTESLKRLAREEIIVESDKAKIESLVTDVAYRDGYEAALYEIGIVEQSSSPRRVTLATYAKRIKAGILQHYATSDGGKVALIYADGVILDGERNSANDDEVISGAIAKQIREAREDDDVVSVVLRVNSPGGSALAAEVIWREVAMLRAKKPVIVSMASYAASGGYYISAPADVILVDQYTVTGSIGVYGVMFAYEKALKEHLHIAIDGVESAPSADFGASPRRLTPLEKRAMQRGVDRVYDTFMERVASGRELSPTVVEVLSGGRVWGGEAAVSNGLADGVGGLKYALALAADRGGVAVDNFEVVEYESYESQIEEILNSIIVSLPSSDMISRAIKLLDAEHGRAIVMHEGLEVCF